MPNLLKCHFPKAIDISQHGLQELPNILPIVDFSKAAEFGSIKYQPVQTTDLTKPEILELVKLIAYSFVTMEPMNRHLNPPLQIPVQLSNIEYKGPLGRAYFGPWTKENIFHWFIRLQLLSIPVENEGSYKLNDDIIKLSLAIRDTDGQIIGGAFNMSLHDELEDPDQKVAHPFIDAISPFIDPPLELVVQQEHEAIGAICNKYAGFAEAYEKGMVGCHFLIARSSSLPAEDTFELVLSSAKHFKKLGYSFLVVSATNNWTGAACEALHGIRVHFSPYRTINRVKETIHASPQEAHSSDGFISDKDSGSMFYLIKLSI